MANTATAIQRYTRKKRHTKSPRMPNKRTSAVTEDNDNKNGFLVSPSVSSSSTPLPWTKQELQGGSTGVGLDIVDPADDTLPPANSSFPVMVGNDAADASSPSLPSAGEGKKRPVDAGNGSSCSSRCTDAPSSRASEREGSVVMDGSTAVVGPSKASTSAAEEPTLDDAVATPRTVRANACLSCSLI